jgi:serine/threonine protein phosphatase PrpC
MDQREQWIEDREGKEAVTEGSLAKTRKFRIDLLPRFRVEVAGLSDVGHKRSNNEDSFGYDLDENLFVVCDGMGGMAAGEVASKTAVELTLRSYKERSPEEVQPEERLRRSIEIANQAVWHLSRQERILRGMGTTLVAACIRGGELIVGHVGDSRAYLLRGGECLQITEDHSLATVQKRLKGPRSDDHLAAHLQQVITRAIGVGEVVEPEFFSCRLQSDDMVLLTTDGLTRYADGETIAEHVRRDGELNVICRSLIGIADAHGAEDNVTCLLLRLH